MVTGIVSLLLGLVGLFLLPLVLSIPGGIVAIVLGVIGRRRARETGDRGGQALAGTLTGVAALVVSGLWIVMFVTLGATFFEEFSTEIRDLEQCIEETGDPEECNQRFTEELMEP